MTTDINSRYTYLDPYVGAKMAVAEAARNIVATGALPIGITDCLNFGSPDNPEVYYELEQAVAGITDFAKQLNTPIVSGNVSLYNETNGQAIYPTPMVGMVGLHDNTEHITTIAYKQANDVIYLVGDLAADFNGSELQKLLTGDISGQLGDFDDARELANQELVRTGIQAGLIVSAHDVAEGGLAIALAESAFKTGLGIDVAIDAPASWYFAEAPSQFVVTVPAENVTDFEEMAAGRATRLGEVTDTETLKMQANDHMIDVSRLEAETHYQEAISWLMNA